MNRLNRAIAVATVAGLAFTAQTTSGSAIQWPWKKDRNTEQVMPPPVEVLPPQQDPTLVAPAPGPAPVVVQEAPIAANDIAARLDRAEARIRELTGQVEELAFRLRQTQDQLAAVTGQPVSEAMPRTQSVAPMTTESAALPPGGQIMMEAPASGQPIDLTSIAGGAPQPVAAAAPTQVASLGDAGADYERAYAAILAGDYVLAEASFRSFISAFPSDQRASDARYWLGESLFARGQYSEAADEFLAGYKAYPDSGKAADTLLKLGLSLAGLGEREAACSTYAEVLRKYPSSSNALRQRVQAEQAVSQCG